MYPEMHPDSPTFLDDDWEAGNNHPAPKTPQPSTEELSEWSTLGEMQATDGCPIEDDGTCEHGHPSWLLHLGLI